MSDTTSPPEAGPPRTGGAVAPARADGVVLIGEMQGSGYRTPPALARRADGQTVQLTPLLYATLAALDGEHTYADVAAAVTSGTGRTVTEDNVRALVEKLAPLGLVAVPGATEPAVRSNPLLGLRFKAVVSDPDRTNRITAPFAALFHWAIAIPVVAGFAWITWWVLVEEGLAAATHEAFARPGLLLAVLAVTVLSAGFHEFGHAAAARRGGATPGVMGAGLYLIWPAFYTDVTDSYRLGRAGRIRTDLGGLYFNAIVALATVGAWWASGYDALLLLVATQVLQMLRQLLPLVRFDGYHVLADITGVPDLFQRIGPTLAALVPWRDTPPEAKALKPWARTVVTAWVVTVVPILLLTVVLLVVTLPRIVGTAWAAMGQQRQLMSTAFGEGDVVAAVARALAAVVVALPVVAVGYLLVRLARQVGGAAWRRTDGRPVRRAGAGLLGLALVAGLLWAWWPDEGRYRPIQPWEGGTLAQAVTWAQPPAGGLVVGSEGAGTVMWPDDQPLPTRADPQLALVAVPTDQTDALEPGATHPDAAETPDDDTWIFPFDEPLPPGEGDNQALAVNTTDGTVTYDVAFALVWADGGDVANNTNDAYALASCDNCAAVAVAFQVVLVTGQTDAAIPINVSVAVNYECTSCLTFALAVQLFVTLDGPLSEEAVAAIEAIWEDALAFAEGIGQVPLGEIQDTLQGFQDQIIAVIEEEQDVLPDPPSGSVTPTPGSTASITPTTTDGTTSSPTTSSSTSSSVEVSPTEPSEPTTTVPSTSTPTATTSPSPSESPTELATSTPSTTP